MTKNYQFKKYFNFDFKTYSIKDKKSMNNQMSICVFFIFYIINIIKFKSNQSSKLIIIKIYIILYFIIIKINN